MAVKEEEEVTFLVQKVSGLHASISKLPDLRPSAEVDTLFSELVRACVPPSPVDVANLSRETRDMQSSLIELCGRAEGLLETHYAEILASYESPLDHLDIFPYYSNYLKLSLLEHTLLARHAGRAPAPARVAFVGSGPLPLTSIVLAAHHLSEARFVNYDIDPAANDRARALVAADADLSARMSFRTADIFAVGEELRGYDVVFLAALVGLDREEKARVLAHLAQHMAAGAALVVRSATGARGFLYPVVDLGDLRGFEVLAVHHPEDDVINSVIVAKRGKAEVSVMLPCKCCEMQAFGPMGHGCAMEEMALEEQIS